MCVFDQQGFDFSLPPRSNNLLSLIATVDTTDHEAARAQLRSLPQLRFCTLYDKLGRLVETGLLPTPLAQLEAGVSATTFDLPLDDFAAVLRSMARLAPAAPRTRLALFTFVGVDHAAHLITQLSTNGFRVAVAVMSHWPVLDSAPERLALLRQTFGAENGVAWLAGSLEELREEARRLGPVDVLFPLVCYDLNRFRSRSPLCLPGSSPDRDRRYLEEHLSETLVEPVVIASTFLPCLAPGAIVAFLFNSIGSIATIESGVALGLRAGFPGLHALIKALSIVHREQVWVGLHPGLYFPGLQGTTAALRSNSEVAKETVACLLRLGPAHSGGCFRSSNMERIAP